MQIGTDGVVTPSLFLAGMPASSGLKIVPKTAKPEVTNVEPDADSLTSAVDKLNAYVAPALQSIRFTIDKDSERIIVSVVDVATGEVLRQIPNEEVLAISETLDSLQGLAIDETA